jgi:hypothetical protein
MIVLTVECVQSILSDTGLQCPVGADVYSKLIYCGTAANGDPKWCCSGGWCCDNENALFNVTSESHMFGNLGYYGGNPSSTTTTSSTTASARSKTTSSAATGVTNGMSSLDRRRASLVLHVDSRLV